MIKIFHTTEKISLNEFLQKKFNEMIENGDFCDVSKSGENFGKLQSVSNSKIRRLIVSGSVKVNGKVVTRPGFELRGKFVVECFIDEEKFFYEKQPDDIDFVLTKEDVIFEDEYIIIVNKPAFLPVEQTITGNRKNLHDAVVDYLWKQNPELRNPPYAGIMHRLDRETSGVIIFTKQRSVNKNIFEQFEKHTIQKTYLAVCSPLCKEFRGEKSFTVEKPLGRISSKTHATKWGIVSEKNGGAYAKTEFRILKEFWKSEYCDIFGGINFSEDLTFPKDAFVVEAKPLTGRTHQIRVHLASKGIPILGDELYGGKSFLRIMLHAAVLEFLHPVSGEKMKVSAKWKMPLGKN